MTKLRRTQAAGSNTGVISMRGHQSPMSLMPLSNGMLLLTSLRKSVVITYCCGSSGTQPRFEDTYGKIQYDENTTTSPDIIKVDVVIVFNNLRFEGLAALIASQGPSTTNGNRIRYC